jgi:hypothetical protein
MDPISALGYVILWSYVLFGLVYFANKILRRLYSVRKISDIQIIDDVYIPVSKQSLDLIFQELNIYSM